MRNNKILVVMVTFMVILSMLLSGCSFINDVQVKLNLKNQEFEYIKQNKVDKIVIQNVRDSGFRFMVNDSKAIDDIYKLLSDGTEVSKKSPLDPDYIFEIYIGDEVRQYKYVVGADERGIGNFYDDDKVFSVPKSLENTIMQNLSFIRKPRDFNYIYYQSILKVIDAEKEDLSKYNKVGVDITGDTDCLKYIFSVELEGFKKSLNKALPNLDLVDNNSNDYDAVIKVKNRGYSSTQFKTLITIEDKKNKISEKYYVIAEYNYKNWDMKVSEPNKVPQNW